MHSFLMSKSWLAASAWMRSEKRSVKSSGVSAAVSERDRVHHAEHVLGTMIDRA
jgi:hypothetical protein